MSREGSEELEPRALADTSIFIGIENERFDEEALRVRASVSVVTIAELRLGVLSAKTLEIRAKRLATLRLAESLKPLPIDNAVADAWAMLIARLREAGKKAYDNDSWIAATAIAFKMPVATQDGDYDAMPGVQVIRI